MGQESWKEGEHPRGKDGLFVPKPNSGQPVTASAHDVDLTSVSAPPPLPNPPTMTGGVAAATDASLEFSGFASECLDRWRIGDYGRSEYIPDSQLMGEYEVPDDLREFVPDGCYEPVLWITDGNGPGTVTLLWPSEY